MDDTAFETMAVCTEGTCRMPQAKKTRAIRAANASQRVFRIFLAVFGYFS